MTVLRAALLFDHPTTRLFASRILESFFCPPRSSPPLSPLPPSPHPPGSSAALPPRLGSFLLPSFLASPFAARAHPSYFSVTVPPSPSWPRAEVSPPPLVLCQPPSIGVLCKQTHESERRIEGFPSSALFSSSQPSIFPSFSSFTTTATSSSSSSSFLPSS